jgi:competence protein ComEC
VITGTFLFVAGVLLLQWQTRLPPFWWVIALPVLIYLFYRFQRLRLLLVPILGLLWALLYAHLVLSHAVVSELEGKDLFIEGVIVSLPDQTPERTSFQFMIDRVYLDGVEQPSPGLVRLGWYRTAPQLQAGDRWGLTVRLKQPHGFINPGGFDYEGWLFQQGIRATGYVRNSERNRTLNKAGGLWSIQRWRQGIRDKINSLLAEPVGAALLNALVVGDRSGIKRQQWELFTATGTNHLIAISGLHIGIVAGLGFFLMRRVWTLSERLTLWLPTSHAAAICALIMACVYAAMAGFSVPTQRALIMLMVFTGGFLLRRPPRPSRSMALALLLVVIWDPPVVLSPGFWLSFTAVAAIFYGFAGRIRSLGWFRQWGRVQWLVSLALAPVLLAMSLQVSLLAPVINLIAVPLFSFLIVPISLLAVAVVYLVEPLGVYILELAAWMLVTGMDGLSYISTIPFVVWTGSEVPGWVWPPAMLGVLLLLSPQGIPARWLGFIFLAPLLMVRPVAPAVGTASITVLDVGQGLAVAVRTHRHTLLYDLGPRFSSEFDAGSAVVLPYLRKADIDVVDLLILSNGDMDHTGGLSGLLGKVEMRSILSGEPQRLDVEAELCSAGSAWNWDGVDFRILHPLSPNSWKGNNASCVLQIEVGGRRILIPGDIGNEVETQLITDNMGLLKADLVVVPHHGSKSSSSPGFIQAVSPSYAVVSAGYRNRYGFPYPEVVGRWRSVGAMVMNTANMGAIEVKIGADGVISAPVLQRLRQLRYWHQPVIPDK